MDEMTLGERLREIRRWHQLSLRDAAGAAGLSVSVWGQVERGDKPVASHYSRGRCAGRNAWIATS